MNPADNARSNSRTAAAPPGKAVAADEVAAAGSEVPADGSVASAARDSSSEGASAFP
ncbi:hypothetical protein Pure01_20050 [Paenarthrobacter ureafaciens]|nr:hypothetical protein Pure01_20050 [Paenarthrobacter ureafaciens]